jgi:NADH-quinone oxidoreductase subunit C
VSDTPKKPADDAKADAPDAKVGATAEQKVSPTHAQETGGAATAAESDNLPVAPGATPGPVVVGERRGMFGATNGGDTTGYGGLVSPVLFPGSAVRPYGGYYDEVVDRLERVLDESAAGAYGSAVERVVVDRGEMTLFVAREHLVAVARALRDAPELRFEMCSGVSGVHYPGEVGRELHAVYHFLSITHNRRIRLEVSAPDSDPHIPSIVSVYPANDWHERETWDFFGIIFDGHPALTRIQMPDDWPGHPQRKDYPLGGIDVEYKGAVIPPPDTRRSYN